MRVALTNLDVEHATTARMIAAGAEIVTDIEQADMLILPPDPAGELSGANVSLQAVPWNTTAAPSPALAIDAPDEVLHHQLTSWYRVAVAASELAERQETARHSGIALSTPPNLAPPLALHVGPPHASFLALEDALRASGVSLVAAFNVSSGLDCLHDQTFDAVIINAIEEIEPALAMCTALRRNAALSRLPAMIISSSDRTENAALQRGAECVARVHAAAGPALFWLQQAVARERHARRLHHALDSLHARFSDAGTGSWRRDIFLTHLERTIKAHRYRNKPLSLAALSVLPAHGANAPSKEIWARTLTEVCHITRQLIREVDCVASFDEAAVLSFPGTGIDEARKRIAGIAAVIECSSFASPGPVVVQQTVIEWIASEDAPSILQRVLNGLDLAA